MVRGALPPGAEAGQRLVNQPIGHGVIVGQSLRQSRVAPRNAAALPAQQEARGNSGFNPE